MTRVAGFKPFYRAHSFTAIAASSINKLSEFMTRNDLINKAAFVVFIEIFLFFKLWAGAVGLMENFPANKLEHRFSMRS